MTEQMSKKLRWSQFTKLPGEGVTVKMSTMLTDMK